MAKLTGNCIVRMDGLSLRMKDAEIEIGGQERETKYADNKRAGYVEKPMCAKVKGTILHGADTDLLKIGSATNVTITFNCDTGVVYTVRDAACTKPPQLKSGGEADTEFEGEPAF